MKGKTTVALALLLGGWVSQSLAGGIVLQTTRVIYDASKKRPPCPLPITAAKCPIYCNHGLIIRKEQSAGRLL